MSTIAFVTKSAESDVLGRERHHMASVVSDIALAGQTRDQLDTPNWTRRLFPVGHPLRTHPIGMSYEERARVALASGLFTKFQHPVTGAPLDISTVILNTALVLGSDVVRLMARLHGQCEIHANIPAPECAWVAGIIDGGRESGVLRANMGWAELAAMLRASAAAGETVVTYSSVTGAFPGVESKTSALRDFDEHLSALDNSLRIEREGWESFRFGDGETMMSLGAATT
ncbi:hypothetical protein [Myxococcus eversor]|uniref:hypothetical protein n=1 Tax=Myxococcus eversor TaxID=2709661 RepID=UPI0013D7BF54|nr:hypothetical protein [Myxococcus eversor]